MQFLLFLLLFFITVASNKFSFRFINSPIYKSVPIFLFHRIILLENKEKTHVFALDFSPIENIGYPSIILKLLQGKSIQGRIRIAIFPEANYKFIYKDNLTNSLNLKQNIIFEGVDQDVTNQNLLKLASIDPQVVFLVKSWGTLFQLYKRNCRHFCNYLNNNYF
jgi:hypothetical protein